MQKNKVCVLLSTYNGEKFLETQLNSLINQTYDNIEIIIRDDGSTDSTHDILLDFSRKYENITLHLEENIGVKNSFFRLMNIAKGKAQYYAFCDQDDFWDTKKIEKAIFRLEQIKNEKKLYCSALDLVDDNLSHLKRTKYLEADKRNAMIQNIVTGCTMVINSSLLNFSLTRLPDERKIEMHDSWLYLVASFFGEVYFDRNSYISYRQHSNNEVGMPSNKLQVLKNSIYGVKRERKEKTHFNQLQEFYKIYSNQLASKDSKLIKDFLNKRKNVFSRINTLRKSRVFKQSKIKTLGFKVLFIFNLV